jgi:dipeptidyl-peptidase 4
MINSTHSFKITVLILAILTMAACNIEKPPKAIETTSNGVQLTYEALYGTWEYNAKSPGTVRWLDEGSAHWKLQQAMKTRS